MSALLANHGAESSGVIFEPVGFERLHELGTDGAKTVATADLIKTRLALRTAFSLRGCAALIGEPGLGKTLAAGTALAELGIPACRYRVPPKPLGKEFEEGFLNAVTNEKYDGRNTRATMRRDMATVCRDHEFAAAFDDVENAEGYGIELVRYVWDQSANRAMFILIGSDLDRFLEANQALRSRITRFVRFHPWSLREACGTKEEPSGYLREYHSIFAAAPYHVLEHAYAEFAHGYAREWARLLQALLSLGADGGNLRLSEDLVDEAISLINQD